MCNGLSTARLNWQTIGDLCEHADTVPRMFCYIPKPMRSSPPNGSHGLLRRSSVRFFLVTRGFRFRS